jgi:hypothetical protein
MSRSASTKLHEAIYARHGLRVAAAGNGYAVLVRDRERAVYHLRLPAAPKSYRVAWWQAILAALDAGAALERQAVDYHHYAR